jgi:hypothetical protein
LFTLPLNQEEVFQITVVSRDTIGSDLVKNIYKDHFAGKSQENISSHLKNS